MRIKGNLAKIKWHSHEIPSHSAHWHLPKCLCVARVREVEAAPEPTRAGAPHAASLLAPLPAEKEEPTVSSCTILFLIKALHLLWHKTN